ncbi:glycosyltransferase family 39 protein [Candidatus Saccharibacteria bacterium]|nr:glycosyltransferase family 39 protein [Candidatus Saccharibacteria bacterium]MCP5303684.1 glycosyltransferase family 39 protein [Pseudomonadales bacterium]
MQKTDGKNLSILLKGAAALLILLALYLRLHAVLHTEVIAPVRADAADYYAYAYNLRYAGVYSAAKPWDQKYEIGALEADAVRSPGYPLFVAPFVSGMPDRTTLTNIVVVQALISTLSVLIAYLLYRRFLAPPWALTAGLLTCLSPHLISMNVYILTESLFTFLLLLTLWLFTLYQSQERITYVFLAGLMLGAATLTRPSLQYFIAPMLIMIYLYLPAGHRSKAMITLSMGLLVLIGPWHIRNVMSTGEVSDSRLMVNFLHHGMYPDFQYRGQVESTGFPYRYDPDAAEISKDIPSVLSAIEQEFARQPARQLHWYLIGKPETFWSWDIVQGMGDVFVYEVQSSPYFGAPLFQGTHWLMKAIHYPIVVLGMLAAVLVWLPRWGVSIDGGVLFAARSVSLLLLYYTAMHMVGAPFPRYSVPLQPFLFGMAVFCLVMLRAMWGRSAVERE